MMEGHKNGIQIKFIRQTYIVGPSDLVIMEFNIFYVVSGGQKFVEYNCPISIGNSMSCT